MFCLFVRASLPKNDRCARKDIAEIRRMRKQAVGGAADNKQGHRMDDTTVVVGFKVSVSNFQGRRVFQWLAGQEEGGAQH
jgi:hypothetical protein